MPKAARNVISVQVRRNLVSLPSNQANSCNTDLTEMAYDLICGFGGGVLLLGAAGDDDKYASRYTTGQELERLYLRQV